MLDTPDNVKTAKNLTYAMCCISLFIPVILHSPSQQEYIGGMGGVVSSAIACYNFYKGRNWARIWFLISTIIGGFILFLMDLGMSSQSFKLPPDLKLFLVVVHGAFLLQIIATILLFTAESNDWFREIKQQRSQEKYVNSSYTYKHNQNWHYNNNSNRESKYQNDYDYQDRSIIIKCPRCFQKLRVPGNRAVIARCPKCGLEFKTDS